uniref:Putative secreted protein n=1 Tax=Ixodes ricinus TaxID=34613 RepID=A0A6B0UXH9_IXORI
MTWVMTVLGWFRSDTWALIAWDSQPTQRWRGKCDPRAWTRTPTVSSDRRATTRVGVPGLPVWATTRVGVPGLPVLDDGQLRGTVNPFAVFSLLCVTPWVTGESHTDRAAIISRGTSIKNPTAHILFHHPFRILLSLVKRKKITVTKFDLFWGAGTLGSELC